MEMVQMMEWSETPWGNGKMMIEQAKEELQILEAQHPNRYQEKKPKELININLKLTIDVPYRKQSTIL
ncbi:hypothetical protein RHGRI_030292 [Rhododendron griersonianum]|uniref:Uncharacterized protein n=1 Tax=Rhododendron griersonianum TaxID=479676 RepID=A0AAV6ITA3_9ERIC|nr:hypothetical protein RHGRI_030292 [Rhododendron griersonianum]